MIIQRGFGVRSRAPLRLSFAGGGSEIPEFIKLHGGKIISSTISKYAYTSVEWVIQHSPLNVNFVAQDTNRNYSLAWDDIINNLDVIQGSLPLHEATFKYFVKMFNIDLPHSIRISTFCDAPEGSGLGSSSTLTVSIIHAISSFFGVTIDRRQRADLAYLIERQKLKFAGGLQDHFSASYGGLNYIDFKSNGEVTVNQLRLSESHRAELETWLTIFYTGKSRESGLVIDDQITKLKSNDREAISQIIKIRDRADRVKDLILNESYYELGQELHDSWLEKKELGSRISNDYIDSIYQFAIRNGAIGGKLSGAGGGGYFLFICPPENRIYLLNALREHFHPLHGENVSINTESSQAWNFRVRD